MPEQAMGGQAINDESPAFGDRMLIGTIGEASNLIPFLSTDSASSEISSLLYIAPLRYNKNLEIEPWAAASYEVLEGGKLLRFVLRDDLLWEDGQAVTADDVEFTYQTMIDPKTPTAYAGDFLAIQSFTKTGPLSFEVRYEKNFARSLSTWMQAIMPKHRLQGQDIANTPFSRKPIGAGPYRLKEWNAGSSISLTASPSYFLGKPYISEVVYRVIPDNSTMFMELKAGRLDMMGLSPQQYLRQTTGPKWDAEWRKYSALSFSYSYLGYNLSHPLFADRRVRLALSHAIDREAIIAGALLGQGKPTIGPYKPETWPYNTEITPHGHSVEKARQLLAEAGWAERDKEGWLVKDGRRFSFTILTNQGNDQRIKAAVIIQHQLKALGIEVRVRTIEWAAFINEFIHKGRFEAVLLAWTIPQDPDGFDVWHSSKAKPGGLNFVGFKNAEADALLEQARAITNQQARKKLYDRFQEILHAEQPYAFLFVPYSLPIIHARFHGINPAPAGIMHNFDRWFVPKAQQRYQVLP